MIDLEDAPGVQAPPRVEYRTIAWADGYRFGCDGSAWSCWLRGGAPEARGAKGPEWRRLRPTLNDDGYLSVKLRTGSAGGKLHRLHVLICEAFHGPKPDGMEVLHDPDRTPTNCRADNLRWGTSKENKADAERHGTRAKGERNGRAKLEPGDIPVVRHRYDRGDRPRDVADDYGVDPGLIRQIGQRKLWRHIPEADQRN